MKRVIGPVLVTALLIPLAGSAQTTVTGNAGWISDYFYRGFPQKVSSASIGLDVESHGLNVGIWGAQVGEDLGDGNEVDLYGGYGVEIGELNLGVGGTGYFYTGEWDDTYLEANFTAGIKALSVEFSIGQWRAESPQNYWFLSATLEQNGFYGTVGTFGDEFDGEYLEAGYGFTTAELDFTVGWIFSTSDLLGARDETLVFGVSRTFEIN